VGVCVFVEKGFVVPLFRVLIVTFVALVAAPAVCAAQDSFWGVSASFTPTWKTPDAFKRVFQADSVDLSGSEVRVGIVRGRSLGGDWGVSFVRKSLKSGGVVDGEEGRFVLGEDVTLTGGTLERFGVFSTIKDRVQIGMLMGIGAAQISGSAIRDETTAVPAAEALRPLNLDIKFSPLARLELGVAIIVAEGFKVRASGGLTYPGYTTFSVGGIFLFER